MRQNENTAQENVITVCQLSVLQCPPTLIYFLLKNWRAFLVITVAFIHVAHNFRNVAVLQKMTLLLWRPFLGGPCLAEHGEHA